MNLIKFIGVSLLLISKLWSLEVESYFDYYSIKKNETSSAYYLTAKEPVGEHKVQADFIKKDDESFYGGHLYLHHQYYRLFVGHYLEKKADNFFLTNRGFVNNRYTLQTQIPLGMINEFSYKMFSINQHYFVQNNDERQLFISGSYALGDENKNDFLSVFYLQAQKHGSFQKSYYGLQFQKKRVLHRINDYYLSQNFEALYANFTGGFSHNGILRYHLNLRQKNSEISKNILRWYSEYFYLQDDFLFVHQIYNNYKQSFYSSLQLYNLGASISFSQRRQSSNNIFQEGLYKNILLYTDIYFTRWQLRYIDQKLFYEMYSRFSLSKMQGQFYAALSEKIRDIGFSVLHKAAQVIEMEFSLYYRRNDSGQRTRTFFLEPDKALEENMLLSLPKTSPQRDLLGFSLQLISGKLQATIISMTPLQRANFWGAYFSARLQGVLSF